LRRGRGWTRDGTLVDLWDDRGIQTSDADPVLTFEAGWTAGGAVCIAHTRIPENITRDLLPAAGGAPYMRRRFGARRRCAAVQLFALSRAITPLLSGGKSTPHSDDKWPAMMEPRRAPSVRSRLRRHIRSR